MRAIGKFKDKDVLLRTLHLGETYEGFLLGDPNNPALNQRVINVKIKEKVNKLFGRGRPFRIIGKEKIDYSAPLSHETGYAWLECLDPIKKGDGSYLILVWFQSKEQDPP